MPSIPLPFVGALMLAVLLMRMIVPWHRDKIDRAALSFVAACILIELLSGLRWNTDLQLVRSLRPVFAATLPPLAWVCFNPSARGKALHLFPIAGAAFLALVWQPSLDLGLASIYIGYGVALLLLAYRGPDAFSDVRLDEAGSARRAAMIAGFLLLGLAVIDLFVAADFRFDQGVRAASIVAAANVLIIVLVAFAIASVGSSRPVADEGPESAAAIEHVAPPVVTPDDADIAARINALMHEKQLFRDPDLTLQRLARRASIPARQISSALNRVYGRNVSQVVNDYRIELAQRLLRESNASITRIQFESGFQTKSNFNREFRRVAGMNPREWRLSAVAELSETRLESE